MSLIIPRSSLKYKSGYTVYITANRIMKTLIGIADEMNGFSVKISKKFSSLIYFERFVDRKKAINKKRMLEKKDKKKIDELISKNNPEWLNIIFILSEEVES